MLNIPQNFVNNKTNSHAAKNIVTNTHHSERELGRLDIAINFKKILLFATVRLTWL